MTKPANTGAGCDDEFAHSAKKSAEGRDNSRSAKAFARGRDLKAEGHSYEQMREALLSDDYPEIAEWARTKGLENNEREMHRIYEKAGKGNDLILSPSAPYESARAFIAREFTRGTNQLILHHQAVFRCWEMTHYRELPAEEIRAAVWNFLASASRRTDEGKIASFNPNAARVSNVLDALAALAQLHGDVSFPFWCGGRAFPPATEILSCANGLLHLPTRKLLPHMPSFANLWALGYDYNPSAPEPIGWTTFLKELWPEDQESIDTLQEIFGLLLTGDTSYQKAFLIVGPRRGGKGTIGRILRMLLGPNNVAGPTLKELETNFGLSPLIYKPLAIISDARLSGKMDSQIVIERLLSITGEDSLNVPRKFLPDWIGQLPTRFLILTNELPNFPDTSGAISSRFILLQLTQTFLGREDRQLTEKLSKELSGILNWALDGLVRLTNRGHFILPKSSEDALEEFEHLSSPIKAFVRDCCTIGHGKQVSGAELFEAWRSWCTEQGRDHAGTIQAFGKNLRTAFPFVKDTRPRGNESRHRLYQGLSLKPTSTTKNQNSWKS